MKSLVINFMQSWDKYYFSYFRILFGVFLLYHFSSMFNFVDVLFSYKDSIQQHLLIPMELGKIVYQTEVLQYLIVFASLLSIFITLGFKRRLSAIGLIIIHALLTSKNHIYTYPPTVGYIGFLLLTLVILKEGERFSIEENPDWQIDETLINIYWIVFGLSFTMSAIAKAYTSSWQTGNALYYLIHYGFLMRESILVDLLMMIPRTGIKALTYLVLFLEFVGIFCVFNNKLRKWFWWAVLFFHISILLTVGIGYVSIGMIIFMLPLYPYNKRVLE